MKKIIFGVILLVIVALLSFLRPGVKTPGVAPREEGTDTSEPATAAEPLTIPLMAQSNSGESGFATLTEEGGKVKVSLIISGEPDGVEEPAHIHLGACPKPGEVKYPLTPVADGISETTLGIPLATILSGLPLAVNVHKSAAEAKVYVACGDILTAE